MRLITSRSSLCDKQRYLSPQELLAGRFNPTFLQLCRYGLNTALGIAHIHGRGQYYGDLSHLNLFLNRENGGVRFIDNDNVVTNHTECSIVGTPPYMAPELFPFRSPHLTSPNILTDRYSLAVLLYHFFVREHPLHGQRFNEECRVKDRRKIIRWYGEGGSFAFDPTPNNTNPPDPNLHRHAIANWEALPTKLQEYFIRSFGEGRREPSARLRVSEWMGLFAELPDRLFKCRNADCGADNFSNRLGSQYCWKCRNETSPAVCLRFANGPVVCLSAGAQLFEHHLQPLTHRYRFAHPAAVIEKHPAENRYGFRNLSEGAWYATNSDGATLAVPPGRVVALRPALRLNFGKCEAAIERVI